MSSLYTSYRMCKLKVEVSIGLHNSLKKCREVLFAATNQGRILPPLRYTCNSIYILKDRSQELLSPGKCWQIFTVKRFLNIRSIMIFPIFSLYQEESIIMFRFRQVKRWSVAEHWNIYTSFDSYQLLAATAVSRWATPRTIGYAAWCKLRTTDGAPSIAAYPFIGICKQVG